MELLIKDYFLDLSALLILVFLIATISPVTPENNDGLVTSAVTHFTHLDNVTRENDISEASSDLKLVPLNVLFYAIASISSEFH